APQVTLINDHGGDPIADTYRFSFKVCNDTDTQHAPVMGYRVNAEVDVFELTLDHAPHGLLGGQCETFVATNGVFPGLQSVKIEVQPTSGEDGYGSNNVNNRVFAVDVNH